MPPVFLTKGIKMKYLPVVACVAMLFTASFCQAGVIFGGTRVIYPSDKKEVQLPLKNIDSSTRHLVQSWVALPDGEKAPFLVTPPLLKLDEKKETLLHIIYTGKTPPVNDRETLYYLNIKTIGNTPDELKDKSRLQIAIHSEVKLFLRPNKLSQYDADRAWEKITFSRRENKLHAKNPTPFYVSFKSVSVGGRSIVAIDKKQPPARVLMVPPYGEQIFAIPAGANGPVSWTAINDYGGLTETKKQPL